MGVHVDGKNGFLGIGRKDYAIVKKTDSQMINLKDYREAVKRNELLELKNNLKGNLQSEQDENRENLKLILKEKIQTSEGSKAIDSTLFWPMMVALLIYLLSTIANLFSEIDITDLELRLLTIAIIIIVIVNAFVIVSFIYVLFRHTRIVERINFLKFCYDAVEECN